jgi:hypothetical protein
MNLVLLTMVAFCPLRGVWSCPVGFPGLLGVHSLCLYPSGPRLSWRSFAAHVSDPLRFSPCPAALWPVGLASLPGSPPKVLVPTPPQGPGALPTPEGSPLRFSRRCQAAAARTGALCASAGCWGSPADAPRGPRRSALHYSAALRLLSAVYAWGPGVSSSLALISNIVLRGFALPRLRAFPRLP